MSSHSQTREGGRSTLHTWWASGCSVQSTPRPVFDPTLTFKCQSVCVPKRRCLPPPPPHFFICFVFVCLFQVYVHADATLHGKEPSEQPLGAGLHVFVFARMHVHVHVRVCVCVCVQLCVCACVCVFNCVCACCIRTLPLRLFLCFAAHVLDCLLCCCL